MPPDWVEDIPGTEAWALLQAASLALPGTTFLVDCQPCVDAVHKGIAFARSDKNPLARVHTLLAEAMSDVPSEATIWIPSHMKAGTCGTVVRGDGFLMTEVDVEGNDVADKYAKRAVLAHRVPFRIREEIKAHDALTASNAMWLARATLLANDRSSEPARDTQASRVKAAAAAAERRKLAAARILSGTLYRGINPQTGKRTTVVQRSTARGGHCLQRCGKGWRCTTCKSASATWASLATQSCKGHATDRWAAIALNRTKLGVAGDTVHKLVVSEPLTWCYVCAGYAESAPLLLTRPCTGKPRQDRACARRRQLLALRAGRHPETKIRLLPPIPLKRWKEQQEASVAAINLSGPASPGPLQVPSTPVPPPAIADDGTEFTRAFLSRGRGTNTGSSGTATDRILKRLAISQTDQAKTRRVDATEVQASSPIVSGGGGPAEERTKRQASPASGGSEHPGKRQHSSPQHLEPASSSSGTECP